MTRWAVYNEIDKHKAQWLRNLMAADVIAPGEVDERSIEDVCPDDYRSFTQCHFFAGVGVWSYALRRSGWDDDRRIWSASCPCQPFSEAGAGAGFDDERHLWPALFHLVGAVRPERIVGEQVASPAAALWIDLIHADLEAADYAGRHIVFPAAGVGAPNIRHRTYWMADANDAQRRSDRPGWHYRDGQDARRSQAPGDSKGRGACDRLADAHGENQGRWGIQGPGEGPDTSGRPACERSAGLRPVGRPDPDRLGLASEAGRKGEPHGRRDLSGSERATVERTGGQSQRLAAGGGGLADDAGERCDKEHADGVGLRRRDSAEGVAPGFDSSCAPCRLVGVDQPNAGSERSERSGQFGRAGGDPERGARDDRGDPGPVNGFWRSADWLACRDPGGTKWRPVEPWTFPLVNGAPARLGRLRAYGDAINAEAAIAFLDVLDDPVMA